MNRKYTNVNFSEGNKKEKLPASGVGDATLNGVGNFVGSGSMIGEGVAVTSSLFSSFGYRTDLGNHVGEGVATAFFNQVRVNLGTATGEGIAVANFGLFGSGGAIDIYDGGVLVKAAATSLNFIGAGILSQTGSPDVEVWVPPPSFMSHWNTTDGTNNCTVSNVATTNRYVSAPTVEGTPFYASTWADGALHPVTRTSPLSWSAGPCLFDDATTIFSVTITDPSGTIASNSIVNISGNTVSTLNNITITISGWSVNGSKFEASIAVSVNVAALLPASGILSILMRHASGGTNYDKTN